MEGAFDALEFASYVRNRWLTLCISCGVGLTVAVIASWLLPNRYTATASILIDPPGANDPRAATAVSPVYLESLKTYERFASSDTLFLRAVEVIRPTEASGKKSIESLKRQVLKVSKPPSTAMLEISACLGDPKKAQALAQYVAEQTVALNRSLEAESAAEMTAEYRTQLNAASIRYAKAQQAQSDFLATQPVDSLESQVQETLDLKFRLERDLTVARTELADYTAQQQAMRKKARNAEEDEWLRRQITSTEAKVGAMVSQTHDLAALLAKKGPELEQRKARRDAVDANRRATLAAYEAANTRMNEILSSSKFHGERLQILDPGIVPQQPSSPDMFLNVAAALVLSLIGSLVYLAFRFSYSRVISVRAERTYSLR